MEIVNIKIQGYKSIKEQITIDFKTGLPTVLIGKNGSGKTNILEALEVIASANSGQYYSRDGVKFNYEVEIKLSQEDMKKLLPEIDFEPDKCRLIAFNGEDMKICRIESEYLVPLIKNEIIDVKVLAERLQKDLNKYERQLAKICRGGDEDSGLQHYEINLAQGHTTNYAVLKWKTEQEIGEIKAKAEQMLKTISDEEKDISLTFTAPYQIYSEIEKFALKYVEPELPYFEKKYITINSEKIKAEIKKINKQTEEACNRINETIKIINERTKRVEDALETAYYQGGKINYYPFLREISREIGKKCSFLRNDNNEVLFRDEKDEVRRYREKNTGIIFETYLRRVYSGNDQNQLIEQYNTTRKLQLSPEEIGRFEEYLNKTRPEFDEGMYEKITVENQANDTPAIFLHENTGDKVDLNFTSAGRRWYFTYYFIKNTLERGDLFLIDEPAGMLHPAAQKEMLKELCELNKRGIKVIYSTHSPYLIPENRSCVQFVSINQEGTKVSSYDNERDWIKAAKKICEKDIFVLQDLYDKYNRCDPEKMALNCYNAVINKYKTAKNAAKELQDISEAAIKSWKKTNSPKARHPSLINIIKIINATGTSIDEIFE